MDLVDVVNVDNKILFVEILSCRDLLAADKTGASDPYVKVKLGDMDLHKTGVIRKTYVEQNQGVARDMKQTIA